MTRTPEGYIYHRQFDDSGVDNDKAYRHQFKRQKMNTPKKEFQLKKYALKYKLDHEVSAEGFSKDELLASKAGGTDALLFISILREGKKAHDGYTNIAITSIDGQNEGKPIPMTELFTIFGMLANTLTEVEDLPLWQKQIAEKTINLMRHCMALFHEKDDCQARGQK